MPRAKRGFPAVAMPLRIPENLHQRLKTYAGANERSVNDLCIELLEEAMCARGEGDYRRTDD